MRRDNMYFLIIDNDNKRVNFMVSYLNSICGERVLTNVPMLYKDAVNGLNNFHHYSHIIISKQLPLFDEELDMKNSAAGLLKIIEYNEPYIPVVYCENFDMDEIKGLLDSEVKPNSKRR
jgi:hypothetical protein